MLCCILISELYSRDSRRSLEMSNQRRVMVGVSVLLVQHNLRATPMTRHECLLRVSPPLLRDSSSTVSKNRCENDLWIIAFVKCVKLQWMLTDSLSSLFKLKNKLSLVTSAKEEG